MKRLGREALDFLYASSEERLLHREDGFSGPRAQGSTNNEEGHKRDRFPRLGCLGSPPRSTRFKHEQTTPLTRHRAGMTSLPSLPLHVHLGHPLHGCEATCLDVPSHPRQTSLRSTSHKANHTTDRGKQSRAQRDSLRNGTIEQAVRALEIQTPNTARRIRYPCMLVPVLESMPDTTSARAVHKPDGSRTRQTPYGPGMMTIKEIYINTRTQRTASSPQQNAYEMKRSF